MHVAVVGPLARPLVRRGEVEAEDQLRRFQPRVVERLDQLLVGSVLALRVRLHTARPEHLAQLEWKIQKQTRFLHKFRKLHENTNPSTPEQIRQPERVPNLWARLESAQGCLEVKHVFVFVNCLHNRDAEGAREDLRHDERGLSKLGANASIFGVELVQLNECGFSRLSDFGRQIRVRVLVLKVLLGRAFQRRKVERPRDVHGLVDLEPRRPPDDRVCHFVAVWKAFELGDEELPHPIEDAVYATVSDSLNRALRRSLAVSEASGRAQHLRLQLRLFLRAQVVPRVRFAFVELVHSSAVVVSEDEREVHHAHGLSLQRVDDRGQAAAERAVHALSVQSVRDQLDFHVAQRLERLLVVREVSTQREAELLHKSVVQLRAAERGDRRAPLVVVGLEKADLSRLLDQEVRVRAEHRVDYPHVRQVHQLRVRLVRRLNEVYPARLQLLAHHGPHRSVVVRKLSGACAQLLYLVADAARRRRIASLAVEERIAGISRLLERLEKSRLCYLCLVPLGICGLLQLRVRLRTVRHHE